MRWVFPAAFCCFNPSYSAGLSGDGAGTGGHVRIGLGDEPFTNSGQPTNANLVARLVAMAQSVGREIASPREVRELMGLPQYEATSQAKEDRR